MFKIRKKTKEFICRLIPELIWILLSDWTFGCPSVHIVYRKQSLLLASTLICTHPWVYLAKGIHSWTEFVSLLHRCSKVVLKVEWGDKLLNEGGRKGFHDIDVALVSVYLFLRWE